MVSLEQMQGRLVRYTDLVPCRTAFIDARTPGSDQKENFCIIGPGVAENPGQHVHVRIAHGFNIGGARQPVGCVNSQHSHETAEVFMVHSGEWAFRWGHDGTDGETILTAGDVISLPVNVFRGFECVGGTDSFLFAILGGDDPGHVTWAPYVFENAAEHGLVLTQAGRLIDTASGEVIPEGDAPCRPTSGEDLSQFRRMTDTEMGACVVRAGASRRCPDSALTSRRNGARGVSEHAVLGMANEAEGVIESPVAWPHGFHFREVRFAPGGTLPLHARHEEEVIFVQDGSVTLLWEDHRLVLNKGDTITLPKGVLRQWSSDQGASVFVVRGGDHPAPPHFGESSAPSVTNIGAVSQAGG